jgi:hypothetical protein
MKTAAKSAAAVLLIASMSGNVLADSGRYGHSPAPYHHEQHRDRDDSGWIGALLLFGITAAVLSAASEPSVPPPAPAYVLPPPQEPAPQVLPQPTQTGMWHFCHSSGQYYPYVRSCPEAWELVTPTPPM